LFYDPEPLKPILTPPSDRPPTDSCCIINGFSISNVQVHSPQNSRPHPMPTVTTAHVGLRSKSIFVLPVCLSICTPISTRGEYYVIGTRPGPFLGRTLPQPLGSNPARSWEPASSLFPAPGPSFPHRASQKNLQPLPQTNKFWKLCRPANILQMNFVIVRPHSDTRKSK